MTHPNFQTNGASLEDCHTNFFALTELSGIKWRKLVWCEGGGGLTHHGGGGGSEPLDDPVLRSYARCLAADILCVWRRVSTPRAADVFELGPPPPAQPPPLNLSASKELWIFWYGEEPDLNELVAPELNTSDCEQGSWESGLSYKCRSLLFKALHNLIERCLLSRDFVRLGKWFVQPYDGPKKPGGTAAEPSGSHLSFSFAFFVHGESTVCASVDVRQHPPVRRLTRAHILQAQASTGIKVILAPFGLSGTLTGMSFKSPDASARLLEEWSQFYPMDKSVSLTESSVVEVIVGGVKMRYPSCYVLVTDLDDSVNESSGNDGNNMSNLNLSTANMTTTNGSQKNGSTSPITVQTPPPSPVPVKSKVSQPGPYSVSQEHPLAMSKESTAATVLPERAWQECVHGGPPGSNAASSGTVHEFSGHWDLTDPTKRATCTCSKCTPPFNPQDGPPSYPRTQESMAIPSVGSPPSVAPSPLPNPHSHQPASVPPGDQTLPTLSPHPLAPSPAIKSFTPPEQPSIKLENEVGSPQTSATDGGGNIKTETPAGSSNSGGSNAGSTSGVSNAVCSLKRPLLIGKDYEAALGEEEQPLDMLYDYSMMDAWLNHPVKRFKPNNKENERNNSAKNDLYSMYFHNGVSSTNLDLTNNISGKNTNLFIKQEIKQEGGFNDCESSSIVTGANMPHGVKRPGDPYEFDEEGGSGNMDGFKRGSGGPGSVNDESNKDLKKNLAQNLFTSEGLQPSYKDLDQIFDNSDDTSGDETMQIQTPPGSTHMNNDDNKRFSGHGTCSTMGILRPEELSKMFPTPPSLEHNPIASPCDLPPSEYTDLGIVKIKQEIYPNMGSPQEEHIEDWSFVFKPPSTCKMVGSSKYAPLTNLPSQNTPPLSLPTHCVYKPSWMQHVEKPLQPISGGGGGGGNTGNPVVSVPQPMNSLPRSVTPGGGGAIHQNMNPFSPNPLHSFRPPPPPYELASPATSTHSSSYHNKNLNSVEPVTTPSVQRTPEASSLLLNILLTDTAFNIFRDHNFDSCTLCVCNGVGNIRGADASVYLVNSSNDSNNSSSSGSHHHHYQQNHLHQGHPNGTQPPGSPYPGMGGMGQPPPYGMMSPQHHGHAMASAIEEDSIRCSCGFSAVVNRRLAYGSGLFYEDEKEITGITEDPAERKKSPLLSFLITSSSIKMDPNVDRDQIELLPHDLLDLIREQCAFVPCDANALVRCTDYIKTRRGVFSNTVNVLEFTDSNEVTSIALDQSRQATDNMSMMCKMEDVQQQQHKHRTSSRTAMSVHRWPFLKACGPQCNQDIVRVMKALQPLLQDAIQKKCQTRLWEAPSAVKGPLTWRQFHRLAGRGTDDRCEPQPIPSVVVGHEKDWLSLSPYALQHWETLLLEPYSYARDVAYVVVAPDNDAILPRVRSFFKELSTAYEMCKLGRHSPITKVLRDGILRVGKTAKTKIGNEAVEEWFTLLGESETTDMLKLYAQVCKHHLAPHLQQVPMDKTLLDPPESTDKPMPSPMPPPSTPDNSGMQTSTPEKAPSTPKSEIDGDNSKDTSPGNNTVDSCTDDDEREAPCIVVYLVEPFSLGSDQPELQRLACLALLRCFQSIISAVPDSIRSNISVQIISLESIVELGRARDRTTHSDQMRALSLNIFSQCRRLLVHTNNVKSLTGFGTAAMADLFLKSKDEKNRAPYKLYTPPYILAPLREKIEAVESFGKGTGDQASVLYLSYCLSDDQSWLLAVATDERGEIYENITINVDIPNRSRRKKASARRIGLEKLMNFILGVMSQSARPWRLVVGRLGRIGHGELKGWSWLLSRKNLLKASRHLKDLCTQCSLMYPSNVPCILSACLVSLEPDTTLRLMPDQFTPDERFSQASVNSQLSTPQDVSCTHILVFPTSATTQSSQTAFQEQHITPELGDDEILNALNDDMPEGIDEMNDFVDIFNWTESGAPGGQSPNGSPRREESAGGSPNCGMNAGRQGSPFQTGVNASKGNEPTEEVGQLLQQPLALGYLVSTAPTGKMPKWFWATCPHLEGVCPAFLKNALHLHSPNVQQNSDDLFQQSAVTSHPLDSQYTTDVLRYVLEGYNALSWLALDSNTKDRLSCLPVHMQVLIQLYHTTAALI